MSKKTQDSGDSLFDNLESLESLEYILESKKVKIDPKTVKKNKPCKEIQQNIVPNKTKESQKNYDFTLFCDGASRGKPPGNSSCGMVLFDKRFMVPNGQIDIFELTEPIWQKGQKIGIATNNIAEWKALILGLEHVLEKFKNSLDKINLQVLLDSNLVVQQFNKKWKVKDPNLKLLFQKSQKLAIQIPNISCTHIYRENNFLADKMANLALDE